MADGEEVYPPFDNGRLFICIDGPACLTIKGKVQEKGRYKGKVSTKDLMTSIDMFVELNADDCQQLADWLIAAAAHLRKAEEVKVIE